MRTIFYLQLQIACCSQNLFISICYLQLGIRFLSTGGTADPKFWGHKIDHFSELFNFSLIFLFLPHFIWCIFFWLFHYFSWENAHNSTEHIKTWGSTGRSCTPAINSSLQSCDSSLLHRQLLLSEAGALTLKKSWIGSWTMSLRIPLKYTLWVTSVEKSCPKALPIKKQSCLNNIRSSNKKSKIDRLCFVGRFLAICYPFKHKDYVGKTVTLTMAMTYVHGMISNSLCLIQVKIHFILGLNVVVHGNIRVSGDIAQKYFNQ